MTCAVYSSGKHRLTRQLTDRGRKWKLCVCGTGPTLTMWLLSRGESAAAAR